MGYVDPAYAEPGTKLTLKVIGQRCEAIIGTEPMYDPNHELPRAND